MKLSELIKGCALKDKNSVLESALTIEISSISSRAQDIKPGDLFLAVKGYSVDGHDYIDQAVENGAAAVIAQEKPQSQLNTGNQDNFPNIILVENSRKATSIVAANFYGQPSKDMILVGITGTNGKTTTSWILESIFNACGFICGVIGTINIRYKGKTFDSPITTPGAIELQKALFKMKQAGVTHVIMEVSSHGLDQFRVDGCKFDAGIYTNLTQDHLDYHGTMDEYFLCKQRFFTDFLGSSSQSKTAPAVINMDDARGKMLADSISCPKILVSHTEPNPTEPNHIEPSHTRPAHVSAIDFTNDINGLSGNISLSGSQFFLKSSLTGRFNLENILCASGAALALNIDKEKIQQGIEALGCVPGRLEKIHNNINRHIFVDYAHTPDALESILETLTKLAPARIITVFGCGGDRDRTKRGIMGKIACKYSNVAIATSDNPRSESPEAIVRDIVEGIQTENINELDLAALTNSPEKKGYFKEVNRKKALEMAVLISRPSDIIIAAGKGHETYQITNTGIIHFDDAEELKNAARKFEKRFTPIEWSLTDLSDALARKPVMNSLTPSHKFAGIDTDSRTIAPNQLFLALKGENFDGHQFIMDLFKKGIQGFVVEKGYPKTLAAHVVKKMEQKGIILFETENTLEALGLLARYQRLRSKVKLIAITGSNGKTTTRRITQEIFKTRFHTLATKGNFNNEIGMPLTLLKLSHEHEWAIIEMGMNHPNEISRLSKIACPDIAIITNTSGAHLKGLKNMDNVARAKAEIFEHVRENSIAILFADDPRKTILETLAKKNKNIIDILFFGSEINSKTFSGNNSGNNTQINSTLKSENRLATEACDIKISGQTTKFFLTDQKISPYSIGSPAPFMVNNALAAITAARIAGISDQGIRAGLLAFTPVSGRMEISRLPNGINVINDTYNANPESMTQALKTLGLMSKGKNSIAILGDMLELGKDSIRLHQKIGALVAEIKIARLYLFGKQVAHIMEGALENGISKDKIFWGTKKEIGRHALHHAGKGDWLLLKGSRGMAMETIISDMENQFRTKKGVS